MAKIRFLDPAAHEGARVARHPVRVLGIDLGTTNSTVAECVWDPAGEAAPRARCLAVDQETVGDGIRDSIVPSVVAVVGHTTLVGRGAQQLRRAPGELGLKEEATLFYETKNFIGLDKTYADAPEGFRTPAEIAGHVLRLLYREATAAGASERVVVTVPASFQTNQRAETVRAAALAGIDIAPGDLLDEPVAAFIDWFVAKDGKPFTTEGPGVLLVVDFGGGTCDVAVFRIDATTGPRPAISPRAVSRYHRLGGGDIDRAIVYEALVPQFLAQNDLKKFELGFDAKRNVLEPALLAVAEALKVELCSKPALAKATAYTTVTVRVEGSELRLADPALARAEFDAILEPFLDRDLFYTAGSEYRTQLSMFAPIQDALERAALEFGDVDYVLLAGGSTLIPNVVRSVEEAFGRAHVLAYTTPAGVQTAVARGAAYHAMSLALFGEGVVKAITHDAISLRTNDGLVEIVPKGVELPYPLDQRSVSLEALAVPETCLEGSLELKIEVVVGGDQHLLDSRLWEIPAPVEKGDPLAVEVCLDENQVLHLTLRTGRTGSRPLSMRVENPITHVVNPGPVRERIDRAERELEVGAVPPGRVVETLTSLGRDYAEIGFREKALDRLQRALKRLGRPDSRILHQMGLIAGELGDETGEQKYYLQATAADAHWNASLFNLALAQYRRGDLDDARRHIGLAIERSSTGPQYVLMAKIAAAQEDSPARARALACAFEEFAPMSTLDSWELGWYESAATLKGDAELAARIQAERKARAGSQQVERLERGVLPDRLGR